nr:flagellar basal body rod C-terminal domain-containing protein [Teredinibacter turnerae]
MSLARQYEMQVKIMQTVKEDSEASARLLQPAS